MKFSKIAILSSILLLNISTFSFAIDLNFDIDTKAIKESINDTVQTTMEVGGEVLDDTIKATVEVGKEAQEKLSSITNTVLGDLYDINKSDWFYNNVIDLRERGLIKGYPDGSFKPNKTLQEDEFITILVRAIGKEDELESNNNEYWAIPYLSMANKLGISNINDFSDSRSKLNREDMAVLINNTLDYLDEKDIVKNTSDRNSYSQLIDDIDDISSINRSEVIEVYAKGILTGYPDGEFKPKRNLTRSEASAVILRLIKSSERIELKKPVLDNNEEDQDEAEDTNGDNDDVQDQENNTSEDQQNEDTNSEDEEQVVLPKNYKDFYRISPTIPTYLYEIEPNQKINNSKDAYISNAKLYEDTDMSGFGSGRDDVLKLPEYAEEYLKACYNINYNDSEEKLKEKLQFYCNDSYSFEKYVNSFMERIKENQVISECEFLTDSSLVYQDDKGRRRIRGTFKIRYISNKSNQHIAFDDEKSTNSMADMPIELNKWYEQDIELSFARYFGNGLWERNSLVIAGETTVE